MKHIWIFILCLGSALAAKEEGAVVQFKFVELTHLLTPEVPTWNGSCGFCMEVKGDYDKMFRVQQIKMHAGVGTHMDAPSHCIPGADSIGDIPLEKLVVPACVIDVSAKAGADYEVSVEDVEEYEKRHGRLPSGSLVIAHTGWGRFWSDREAYRNVDAEGQMHFPAFSGEAAEFLLTRDIAGIAIDTLSPDCLDLNYPVHKAILGAGKYIIENIANCSQIPASGSYVIALPLRIEGATEAPVRIVGISGSI
ncbi:MAG: cyclase family protein [Verrucomicrobia bacterium]|nr:cyclase family protein [Verrucomicrobiota bacterium]